MKAMILAAGLGTRLRPLTEDAPKCLVKVAGKPMLEHVIRHLMTANITELVVNVHHHADKVREYLETHVRPRIPVTISQEEILLNTGGALGPVETVLDSEEDFFLYNCDILSDCDLNALTTTHERSGSIVTLAVSKRETNRSILFNTEGHLMGWENSKTGDHALVHEDLDPDAMQRWSFQGIHLINPRIFDYVRERSGAYGVFDLYLSIAQHEKIGYFDISDAAWWEIGNHERLKAAHESFVKSNEL